MFEFYNLKFNSKPWCCYYWKHECINDILTLYTCRTRDNIPDWLFVYFLDRLTDFIFFIDIGVNFRSAYVDITGTVRFDSTIVSKQYIKTWFILDVISILPFEEIGVYLELDSSGALKLPKLLRLLRLMKIFKVIVRTRISIVFMI